MMKAKVFYLEDDPNESQIYERFLKGAGYEVKHAVNQEEAITALKDPEYKPDLLFLDINIIDDMYFGIELAKQFQHKMNVPIIFYSGYSNTLEKLRETTGIQHAVVFTKGQLEDNKQLLLDNIRFAIEAFEKLNGEVEQRPIPQVSEAYLTFNVSMGSNQADYAFRKHTIKLSELLYLKSLGQGVMEVFYRDREAMKSFKVGFTPGHFRRQYADWLEKNGVEDPLIEGISMGFTCWVNALQVRAFDRITVFFDLDGKQHITVDQSIYQVLMGLYPPFRAG